ncbi:MAG: hypothetical protein VX974_09710 [Pseudomonadota bacterium]|nr:hypothetical protein [Pseudomonadota bacterium]
MDAPVFNHEARSSEIATLSGAFAIDAGGGRQPAYTEKTMPRWSREEVDSFCGQLADIPPNQR